MGGVLDGSRGGERLIVLRLLAAAFAAFGIAGLAAPVRMAGVVGIVLTTPGARADYVATYGGCLLGIGVFLWIASRVGGWRIPALTAAGCILAGFGVARALAIVTGGGLTTPNIVGLALEAGGTLLAFATARSMRSRGPM